MIPVIGIVVCGIENQRQFVSCPYVDAIGHSGGLPMLIPYTDIDDDRRKYLSICDGFLFCGGNDVNPLLFGEELLTEKGSTDWNLDQFHMDFMSLVIQRNLPVLGICRGMQILNLALGGSIYQDLNLMESPHLNHMQCSRSRSDVSHKITISPNSLLFDCCSNSSLVNSFHHQCVKTLGKGLRMTAIASDGVIEAIELTSHSFALGVQWHPECMLDTVPAMQNIFFQFVETSKNAKNIDLL